MTAGPIGAAVTLARAGLVAILALCAVGAQTAIAEDGLAYGQGRLWQVQRGKTPPSYVFGTMHVTDWRVNNLPPEIEKAFESSRALVLETKSKPGYNGWEYLQATYLGRRRTLSSIVGTELFRRLQDRASEYGVPSSVLNEMRPWAVGGILTTPVSEHARQEAGVPVLDRALEKRALDEHMRVYGLEEPEDQVKALVAQSEEDQVAMLEIAADLIADQVDQRFEQMVRWYLDGDLDAIHRWALEVEAAGNARLFSSSFVPMIVLRNQDMVDAMIEHLERGRAFVAVGAMHISGEDGVLRLLEKRGYRIKRVL